MFVLNSDTIWLVDSDGLCGGVFRTTNGGGIWQQFSTGGSNPDRIYMFNARIGFVDAGNQLRMTTNGGVNWTLISGETGFNDMYFIDSLTGWKSPAMKKTTNGGLNWVEQTLPQGGNLVPNGNILSVLNKDTIWVSGGYKFFPGQGARGTLNYTSNGGSTWYFQLLDTSYQIPNILYVDFVNKKNGWAYHVVQTGVHTTNGGDTTFYLPVAQISSEIPQHYKLYQNYPNPFNPKATIPFSLKQSAYVRLVAYEVTGKETQVMVNDYLKAGEYQVDFIGKFATSSGVYFYRIEVTDDKSKQLYTETKKMILLK